MRTMGVKGLTLYHLKSHLQKYRLGKLGCKDFPESSKDVESIDTGSSTPTSSSTKTVHDLNEGYQVTEALRVQMEVQRRLHDQLEVQRRLQLRIEAQGKYLQSILEKACKAIINHQGSSSADLEEAVHVVNNKNVIASNMPARFSDCSMESPISSPLLKKRTRPSFNNDDDDGIVDTLPLENGMRQMGWMMTN
ncbi:protein PHR1-LIKE 3-like isoform X2 [Impatiens glandulifera]|nr:protein PHR1-LIKE 3-like isoform X2 [Impatiens glandulifera]